SRLRQAGCELSYSIERMASPESRAKPLGIKEEIDDKLMERFLRVPRMFLFLTIAFVVLCVFAWIGTQGTSWRMPIGSVAGRILIRLMWLVSIFGAFGARCKEFGGWLMAVAAALILAVLTGGLALFFLSASLAGESMLITLLFCGYAATFVTCLNLLSVLFNRSIRRRFK
ncbi:MAG: hypothetical protein JW941_06310, partial [Candidatus Coatesbacteria bacterium]|nr:hypothetical protein [Candidatus Coatesbacteria bacterium]